MTSFSVDDILNRLQVLQTDLEKEIDRLLSEKRRDFRYTLERGKVRFEQGMRSLHRHQKIGVLKYLANARLGHLLSAPLVYAILPAFAFLDLMVSMYQQVCFRIYGIPRVERGEYFVLDRQKLAYLNIIEKANCVYCSYGNGLIEYAREISARTELYWCPIKHSRRTPDPHHLVKAFVEYGDADSYRARLRELRQEIAKLKQAKLAVEDESVAGQGSEAEKQP